MKTLEISSLPMPPQIQVDALFSELKTLLAGHPRAIAAVDAAQWAIDLLYHVGILQHQTGSAVSGAAATAPSLPPRGT